MAENGYDVKLPYAGSAVEKLQLELFMNINETNSKNQLLLDAIELVEFSRDQEDVCDLIETFDNNEQKIVPWLQEVACLKNQIFKGPEIGRLLLSEYDKHESILRILGTFQPHFGLKFELQDISEYLNREILEILTPMQAKFFSDYQEGIRDLGQLRLEYQ